MNNTSTLWEENDSIEQMMKSEPKPISGQSDGINGTKNVFVRSECEDTGNKKKWKRNCPKCGKEKIYSHRGKYNRDIKINRLCRSCWKLRGKVFNGPFNHNCPECGGVISYNRKDALDRAVKENRLCNSCKFSGDKSVWYGVGVMTGKHHSQETIRKIRLGAIARAEKRVGKLSPQYNSNACKYFDKLNEEKSWNLQHAENGGEYRIKELGYWLDAYDKEKNIVVEYDEYYHKWSSMKRKDTNRQNEIIKHLNCKFFRYDEVKNLLYEVQLRS